MHIAKLLRGVVLTLLAAALLTGCDTVVMSPSGDIAMQQRDLLVWATILMLLVIVPVHLQMMAKVIVRHSHLVWHM